MKVFAIILLAVVGTALADSKVTEEDLKNVAIELKNAPLQERPEDRIWNPFRGAGAALGRACSCPNGDKCECSVAIPVLKSKGVIGGRLVEGQIELNLNIADALVINRKFPLAGKQEVCGTLPRSLSAISGCLTVAAIPIPGGVSSCAAVDLRVNGQIGASVNLQCLDIRGGKMSLGGPAKLSQGGLLNFSVSAPFAALAKKLTG